MRQSLKPGPRAEAAKRGDGSVKMKKWVGGKPEGELKNYARASVPCRVEIQWRAYDNYVRKFCAAVVDLLLNFENFW